MQEKNEYEPSQPGTDVGSDGAGNQNLNDETFDQGLAQSINSQTSISDSNGIYCEQVCDSQGQYVTPPMQQNKMNSSYLDSLQKTEKIFRDPKENTEMDEERYY